MKEPVAWSEKWLRRLSWREVRTMNTQINNRAAQSILGRPLPSGIERSRFRRLQKEWARRKREGGGGLAAGKDGDYLEGA